MSTPLTVEPHPVHAAGRLRLQVLAAWAGIAGPLLFTTLFFAQEAVRRAEFDPIAEPVSALEAGPHGWIQQLNFVVFGVLTLVHAAGLHRTLERSPAGWSGPLLLGVSGIALLGAAAWPRREDASGATYDPALHFVAGIVFFSSSALALVALSHRLSGGGHRRLSWYALAAGSLGLVCFVGFGLLVVPDDGPLHPWAGLAQRLLILVLIFPCRITIAELARRIARHGIGQPGGYAVDSHPGR